jgi:hypothetical protein
MSERVEGHLREALVSKPLRCSHAFSLALTSLPKTKKVIFF